MEKKESLRANPGFSSKINASLNGETLKFCYQCGTCTAACPISKFIDIYKPNKILQLCKLGIRNSPQSNAFLFCSACTLCTKNCPQGVKVHRVMEAMKEQAPDNAEVKAFIAKGFDEILEALSKEMPFPLVYSWICLRPPDEDESGEFDKDIKNALDRALARFRPQVTSQAQPHCTPQTIPQVTPQTVPQSDSQAAPLAASQVIPLAASQAQPPDGSAKKVAIIGSGPAGLTAAWALAKSGYKVTVFESLPEPGGMLRTGIPGYRLPKDVLAAEIAGIKALGVDIKTNSIVDGRLFDNLIDSDDYAAVFIASGAHRSSKLGLDGETCNGVVPAIEFLREYNMTGVNVSGKKVIVLGGGNVAIDAACAAKRSGAQSVQIFYRRDRKAMPAHEWEIEDAESIGVEFNLFWAPQEILRDGDNLTGVRFIRTKFVSDKDGKQRLTYNENESLDVEADILIPAIGQAPDLSFLSKNIATVKKSIEVNPYTMETSLPGVFVAGDIVSESASLLEAISGGKIAAQSIIRFLEDNR
jgi:NADPH-dependent glutamate synthase beta subunit-like oxidoreductase